MKSRFIPQEKYSGLLRMPLLRRVLNDSRFQIVERSVDRNWYYERICSKSVTGFNPSHRKLYIGAESSIAEWLSKGCKKDRDCNEGDFLSKEVLFLMHDYLHAWAYLVIQQELPKLKFGNGPITKKSLDDFTFCHLLTEAVATVGLDYWYLSTFNFSDYCDLGSDTSVLTVSFHERNLKEFKKWNPQLTVQEPAFFEKIAAFYSNGEFPGFDLSALKKSPRLKGWLSHELIYGENQRAYTRKWLSYLSNDVLQVETEALTAAVRIDNPWQKKIIATLGDMLWNLIKNDCDPTLEKKLPPLGTPWARNSSETRFDFRFTNFSRVDADAWLNIYEQAELNENYQYLSCQFISAFRFSSFPKDALPILRAVLDAKSIKGLIALFKYVRAKPLPVRGEARDIFFIN